MALEKSPSLNGKRGTVVSYDSSADRYGVVVDGVAGEGKLIRPANLRGLYRRVGGGEALCGDPRAGFPVLPLTIPEAIEWEDTTQRLTNQAVMEAAGGTRHRLRTGLPRVVEVKASSIPGAGLGVFATESIQPGCVVTAFAGVWRDGAGLGSDAYSQRVGDGRVFEGDASVTSPIEGVGQLINDAAAIVVGDEEPQPTVRVLVQRYLGKTEEGRNVAMEVMDGDVVAVAIRPIHRGDEIFHSYGIAYWLARLQRAAMLAHQLDVVREVDSAFHCFASRETSLLASANTAVEWRDFPTLSECNGRVVRADGSEATDDDCRVLCWARLGVEGFALRQRQCHRLAARALLRGVPPERIQEECLRELDDDLLAFITDDG